MMKPVLLVTGASGSLGREVVRQAADLWRVIATYWSQPQRIPPADVTLQLDITGEAAVQDCVERYRPDAIIHTAYSRSANMDAVNVDGTRWLAQAAKQHHARLVHISTDVIFDGTQAPYTEAAQPNPVHAYGRAKAAAESVVLQSQANAVLVRTSLIYSLTGDCHATDWLIEANSTGKEVTLFTDEYRSPVWVVSLAAACLELARHPYQGALNVAGAQRVNRWELGSKLLSVRGISLQPNLKSGLTPAEMRSQRPQDCTLDISLAQRMLRTPLPGLDQVVAQAATTAE